MIPWQPNGITDRQTSTLGPICQLSIIQYAMGVEQLF